MNLTRKDVEYLKSIGVPLEDLNQVKEAARYRNTTYKMGGSRITGKQALELLGREAYLSGMARSAFHVTAVQLTEDSKEIIFDSSRIFR